MAAGLVEPVEEVVFLGTGCSKRERLPGQCSVPHCGGIVGVGMTSLQAASWLVLSLANTVPSAEGW